MDRYVGGEEIDEKVLLDDLERAVARATFFPVVPVCSLTGVGCAELLDLAVRGFPSPAEHPLPRRLPALGRRGGADRRRPRRPAGGRGREDHQRPVRRPAQPGAGLLGHPGRRPDGARLRSLHGVLRRGRRPPRPRRGREDRRPRARLRSRPGAGRRVVAGDICAIGRLTRAETGDTLSTVDGPAGAAAVVDAGAAAAGGDRRAQQGRRGQAVAGARPAGRRGPVAADRQQRRDPPAGAVVHGRVARGGHPRAAHRALRRPRRPGAVRRVAARDLRRPAAGWVGT